MTSSAEAQRLLVIARVAPGIAHALGNATSVIVHAAEVLQRRIPDDPQLQAIRESAAQVAEICRRLVALSKLGTGAPMAFDPSPGIERIKRFLGFVLDPIEVESHLDPKVQSILVDPFELERDIVTLAADARDAMSSTHGRLTIRTLLVETTVLVEVVSPGRLQRLRFPSG